VPCPYCAAWHIKDALLQHFAVVTDADPYGSLPVDLPLFPTSNGSRVDRQGFVDSVEIMATRLNRPVADEHGRSLFGEHVWRITGSRHLAGLDVPTPVVMLLARWGSNVILRYIADAPLIALTRVYKTRSHAASAGDFASGTAADHPSMVRALGELKKLTIDFADLRGALADTTEQLRELSSTVGPAYSCVRNISTARTHAVAGGATSSSHPSIWTTKCGWKFGTGIGLVEWLSPAKAANAPMRCIRCFTEEV
jgi:hypothetical protein